MTARHHRSRDEVQDGLVRRDAAHELRGRRLVAAANQHHGVARLRANHFLRVHAHEVAQVHARWAGKRLVQADGGKVHRQAAGELHAALDGVDELRHVGVARVEAAVRVDDADNGAGERVVAVAEGLDEDFAEEERKVRVAVRGEALSEASALLDGCAQIIIRVGGALDTHSEGCCFRSNQFVLGVLEIYVL